MAEHKKRNGVKNIDTKLDALRADLDALQHDTRNVVGDVENVANDSAQAAMQATKDVAERAYGLAEETVAHLAYGVETWTNDNLDSMRGSVRARPLSAVALSMGAGVLLGAIFLRR
jgi:ElaB/YqjD/DUF883 family membrane-anchored ribosome-binding protein